MAALVLNGVDHVVYVCRDVETVLAWWTGTLGLAGERVEQWRAGEVPFPSVRLSPTALVDLVPGPLGKGELDGGLRAAILERLPRTAFLPPALPPIPAESDGGPDDEQDDLPEALRPRDAEVVEGAGADTVRVLAEVLPTLLPAGLERRVELRAAVAARAREDVPGEALGVDADEHRIAVAPLPLHERDVLVPVDLVLVRHRAEFAVLRR